MAKKNKKFTKELTPLEKYGTTVGFLGLLGWVNLPFVVGFALIWKNNWLGEYSDILAIFFSILSIFTMFCIILSYFKKFILEHSFLTYILISIESIIMLIWIDFIGFLLFSSKDGHKTDNFITESFWIFIFSLTVLFVLSLVFFYFYHKNESVYKLNNYFNNGKASKGAVSVPIIFSGVMASRMFFEGNASYLNIVGLILAVMLTAVTPAAIMSGLFSAAYIRKYPDRKEIQ
ncbi:hypothetical protein [Streptococcus suis]|uniref:hypothetical protein n=1 Tax=Streptococcus suis TaxID=1307 RepID=UPI0004129F1C|nr:hypothetical protein [Streptococcus suis]